MDPLTTLERAVIEKALEGIAPEWAGLRLQTECARVVGREQSIHGFYATLQIPDVRLRLSPSVSLVIADVVADIEGLELGAGFVVFVTDGLLSLLEGYTFGESWPTAPIPKYQLRHWDSQRRDIVIR